MSVQVHFLVTNDNKLVNKEFNFKRPFGLRLIISSGRILVLNFQAHLNPSLLRIVGQQAILLHPTAWDLTPSLEGVISFASLGSHVDRNTPKEFLTAIQLCSGSQTA